MKRLIFSILAALVIHGLFFYWGGKWFPIRPQRKTTTVPLTLALTPLPTEEKGPPVAAVNEETPVPAPSSPLPRRIDPAPQKPPLPAPVKPREPDKPAKPLPPPKVRPAVRRPAKRPADRIEKVIPPRQPAPAVETIPPPAPAADDALPEPVAPQVPAGTVRAPERQPPSRRPEAPPRAQSSPAVQVAPDGLSSSGRGDREAVPRYKENPAPRYPRLAKKRRYEGTVILSVRVTKTGRAAEISIKESSRYAILDQAAVDAVKKWRFEPGMRKNTPVDMWVIIPIHFRQE